MSACAPPPPPLTALVQQAAATVSSRVAPVAIPRVCLDSSLPAGSGMSTPGVASFAQADTAMFQQPVATWSPDRCMVVLHEVLHQVGMANGLQGGDQMPMEEGLDEAVSQDLRPAWLRAVQGHDTIVGLAYRPEVSRVRILSARATHRPWTSSAARHWRISIIAMPPAERPAMDSTPLPPG